MDLGKLKICSLTEENIEQVYYLVKNNSPFFSLPLDFFRRGTINHELFDPDLTLIAYHPDIDRPIAAFIAIITKGLIRSNCYLKICLVDKPYQRQGIGSFMLKELIRRAKSKLHFYSSIYYGDSRPNYWEPGVDLRHTALFFFLKKFGFKKGQFRLNLICHLKDFTYQPVSEKNDYIFERIKQKDFKNTINFVKKNFRLGFWSQEVPFSFENDPPTTFIAKDRRGNIVGWACHSTFFPGSFGPTGVERSLRGKGIGRELLCWCLWDMKQMGLDTCTILWVVGDTVKFYSKVLGAYIGPVFYTMGRLL